MRKVKLTSSAGYNRDQKSVIYQLQHKFLSDSLSQSSGDEPKANSVVKLRKKGGFDSIIADKLIQRHFSKQSEDTMTSQAGIVTKENLLIGSKDHDEESHVKFPSLEMSSTPKTTDIPIRKQSSVLGAGKNKIVPSTKRRT